jgi:tetratricopeptide (TPR) repeat protein
VDISVDDNPEPVAELARIYDLWEANFLIEPYLDSADAVVQGYALDIIERTLAEKDDAQLFNSMAWVLAVRGLYPERALEIAVRAHELETDDPNIMDTVAEAHFAAGDPKSALEWEERALALDPENGFFLGQRARFWAAAEGD